MQRRFTTGNRSLNTWESVERAVADRRCVIRWIQFERNGRHRCQHLFQVRDKNALSSCFFVAPSPGFFFPHFYFVNPLAITYPRTLDTFAIQRVSSLGWGAWVTYLQTLRASTVTPSVSLVRFFFFFWRDFNFTSATLSAASRQLSTLEFRASRRRGCPVCRDAARENPLGIASGTVMYREANPAYRFCLL